ncbi:hypothetical protein QBC38DRAFT_460183 [Podospora fimiseda]|uniref:Uncharacterized protein n=1 Tax=Podospora fimiseda TaxID=252190 RepID=A0AAN7BFS3_9PEZI|nr:hypothetical protein QBC38DRAFT_460183 [Podospora fimiseda]
MSSQSPSSPNSSSTKATAVPPIRRNDSKISSSSVSSNTTESNSGVLLPLPSKDKIYPFRGAPGLYVGREEEIPRPPHVLLRWTTEIEPRLWIDMREFQKGIKQAKRGRKSLPRLSLELQMSGYAAGNATYVELFPRVWILYDKQDWKETIKKFVRQTKWLEGEGLGKVEVRIGSPSLCTITPSIPIIGLDLRSEEVFLISEGLHLYLHVESHESETATGRICCATVTDKANGRILGQQILRIGGVISVNGRDLTINTAHGILELCWDMLQDYDSGGLDDDSKGDGEQVEDESDEEQDDIYSQDKSSN